MLLVNARAGMSSIHGYGLIAQEFIPRGTIIWRFQPGFDVVIPEAEIERLSPAARDQVLYYAYFDKQNHSFILSSDDDRFTNHSDEPNSTSKAHCDGDFVVAIRDIQPGEEITINYREIGVMLHRGNGRP